MMIFSKVKIMANKLLTTIVKTTKKIKLAQIKTLKISKLVPILINLKKPMEKISKIIIQSIVNNKKAI